MAGFFQDDKGNFSSRRLGFLIGVVCHHLATLGIIFLLYKLKALDGATITATGAYYTGGMTVLATYIVQSRKGENKNEKSNNTTTNP